MSHGWHLAAGQVRRHERWSDLHQLPLLSALPHTLHTVLDTHKHTVLVKVLQQG